MRKGDIVHHFLCINLGTNAFLLSTEAVLNIELTHCAQVQPFGEIDLGEH